MKLYVKNLPWGTTRDDVRERFERYGRVSAVDVRKDSANFEVSATVDMPYAGEARRAMNNLDGAIYKYEEKGEILRVEVSLPGDWEYDAEDDEWNDLEVERDDWESRYVLLKKKYDDLKSERDDLKKKYRDLEMERDDLEMENSRIRTDVSNALATKNMQYLRASW